jgi:hypothetical protein
MAEKGTSYSWTIGEIFGVYTKTGSNKFVGKNKMKVSNGPDQWLEGVEIIVEGDIAYVQATFWPEPIRWFRIQ